MTLMAAAVEPTMITFVPPAETLTMNKMLHWSKRARLVKEWKAAAYWAACQLGGPAQRRHGPSLVTVTLPVTGKRVRDPHNWMPSVKAVIDGLVAAGTWEDDNSDWVTVHEPILSTTSAIVVVLIEPRTP